MGGAALGQPWHRQPARPDAHRHGPSPGRRTCSCGWRTRTWRTSWRARPEFEAYIGDMLWAQDYARANRDQMMDNAMREVFAFLGHGRETQRINCHHNFTQREVHGGSELWITRKGAIKADVGDLGVIPGSMGTRSYIVAGKGNEASWTSCSHGAGRRHSRTQAKKLFTTETSPTQMARQGLARQAGRQAGGRDPLGLQGHRRRSWPTRPTSSRSCTRCTRSSTTRAPDAQPMRSAPARDRRRAGPPPAGEVLRAGRSARTREAAGSIPPPALSARCEERGFLHRREARRAPSIARLEQPMVRSSDGGAAG